MEHLEFQPVATIIVVIFALVGAAVVVFGHGLTFEEYLHYMAPFVAALAVGRGFAAGAPTRRPRGRP